MHLVYVSFNSYLLTQLTGNSSVCVKSSLRGERSLLNDVLKTFTEFIGSNLDYESQELVWNGVMHLIDIVTSEAKPEGHVYATWREISG